MKKHLLMFVCAIFVVSALWAQNPRHVVVYDLTSTDCGHCSCMDSVIRETILPTYPLTIPIGIHSPFMGSFFNDYQGVAIFHNFHSTIAPAGYVDGNGIQYTWHETPDAVTERYDACPDAPIGITISTKQWDPVTRTVSMAVDFTNLTAAMDGVFRCQLFVTEDNLIHLHRVEIGCATPDDSTGLPFRHQYINEHVIRKVEFLPDASSVNPHWGNDLITPAWPGGETVTRTWTIGIDTGWVETNCFLNLVVYKDNQDSLFKSEHLQGNRESVTGGVGIPRVQPAPNGSRIALVYPNPASGWMNIHLDIADAGPCTLELLDLNGRVAETLLEQLVPAGRFNVEYNASELPSGTYVCRLRTSGGESAMRVVVRKPD